MRIAITSNLKEYHKGYIDFIDHYWLKFFETYSLNYILVPNRLSLSTKCLKKKDVLILSGGNDILSDKKTSKIRNQIEINLIKKALKLKIPILGICRGAQLLNLFFGGKIKKINSHMKTRHNIFFKKNKIFKIDKLNVNSFHNYGIKQLDLSEKLEIIAYENNMNIECFQSKKKNIIGVMWHPEREKNFKNLIEILNFLKI